MATARARSIPIPERRPRAAEPRAWARAGRVAWLAALALVITPVSPAHAKLAPEDLAASGLRHEATFRALYVGDFERVRPAPDSAAYSSLFSAYIGGFGRLCPNSLPPDKVELTEQVCAAETVTRNGWGVEVSRYCSQWTTRGTGVYADPRLHAASQKIQGAAAREVMGNMFRGLAEGGTGGMMNMVSSEGKAMRETRALIEENGCESPALRRLEENMRRYALGTKPIAMAPGDPKSKRAQAKPPAKAAHAQDYEKLMDDLIAADARHWMINRYQKGKVSRVDVGAVDDQGRPRRIEAHYVFVHGMGGGPTQGTATLEFVGGEPRCLVFFDQPAGCKAPDMRTVAKYKKGEYVVREVAKKEPKGKPAPVARVAPEAAKPAPAPGTSAASFANELAARRRAPAKPSVASPKPAATAKPKAAPPLVEREKTRTVASRTPAVAAAPPASPPTDPRSRRDQKPFLGGWEGAAATPWRMEIEWQRAVLRNGDPASRGCVFDLALSDHSLGRLVYEAKGADGACPNVERIRVEHGAGPKHLSVQLLRGARGVERLSLTRR